MAYLVFFLIVGACGFLYWKDARIRQMVNNAIKGQTSEEQVKKLEVQAKKLEAEAAQAEKVRDLKDKISTSKNKIKEAKRVAKP